MKIQQLYYTSCRKGISSGMGFQTYSLSEGITEAERKEIESYCMYIPPSNLPSQPTKDEIDIFFPTAFSYFILENGKQAVCQAKYTGKDYSGRFGNYFCHVLLFEKGEMTFHPIQIYGSEVFKKQLTQGEENAQQIESLQVLQQLPLGRFITLESVSEFLKGASTTKRSKSFKNMMNAVIEYHKEHKKIIFCDTNENNVYWIAAVQMCLPLKLSKLLTFTTYSNDCENTNYTICGTSGEGTKINFKDCSNIYKYNAFDFINGYSSDFNHDFKFSKLAQVGLSISKDSLLPFIDFIDKFDYDVLDDEIDNCLYLYNMIKKGIAKMDTDSIIKGIDFVNNYASIETFKQLFIQIEPMLKKISGEVDLHSAEVISKFLFNIALKTKNEIYIKNAFEFFFNALYFMVVDRENIKLEEIIELHDKIRAINSNKIDEFITYSFDSYRLDELYTYMEGAKARHAQFYLYTLFGNFEFYSYRTCNIVSWESIIKNTALVKFIDRCVDILTFNKDEMKYITKSIYKNEEYFANFMVICHKNALVSGDSEKEKIVLQLLKEAIQENDEAWELKIRNFLSEIDGGEELLFKYFVYELNYVQDKSEYFWDYCDSIFNKTPRYKRKYFSKAALEFLNNLENSVEISKESFEILKFILNNCLKTTIDESLLYNLISNFEKQLEAVYPEEEIAIIIPDIKNLKRMGDIVTKPDVTGLVHFGMNLQQGTNVIKTVCGKIKLDFDYMDRHTYRKYLSWYLSNIYINGVNEDLKVDYQRITDAICLGLYEEIYYEALLKTLEDILNEEKVYKKFLNENKLEGYEVFFNFIIYVFRNIDEFSKSTINYITNKTINILSNKSTREMKKYEGYMSYLMSLARNKSMIRTPWDSICKKIHGNREISIVQRGINKLIRK
ncbi:GAP1-N2 domain-containing protein [Clostridium tagluense]|uniref:GAP1-N2 domain-containing protein n=1 Tax=Clostridium tagluense TaxID=360422 RepID=UPI001C6F23DB|nr:hypothetical protein [Clostridium tagluense]MBW9159304.1 hypothetical protein [Clostridium tagluense]WLC67765.1 hypothetical protein KTC93_11595 [Clostridium tagluense]